jgi:CTP:molybdopterin cytidylyltransferase MocA
MTAAPPPSGPKAEQKVIAGLILAGGASSRMAPLGIHKALLGYHGRTFLESIVATLCEAGVDRIIVVLGHSAEEIQGRLAGRLEPARVVINRDYTRGQTSSLQVGLNALTAADGETQAEALILCLVDHPTVSAETIRALIQAFRQSGAPAVIPTYRNQGGHPVLISRSLFRELKSLGPDAGANAVIRKYRDATRFLEVNDPGVLVDVDDPESYFRLSSPGI